MLKYQLQSVDFPEICTLWEVCCITFSASRVGGNSFPTKLKLADSLMHLREHPSSGWAFSPSMVRLHRRLTPKCIPSLSLADLES